MGLLVTTGHLANSAAAHRLEVVRSRVVGDFHAEHLALHVPAAIVKASPDACLDELGIWLRERLERPHSVPSGIHESARDLERPTLGVVAEEHPQHGDVCAVEAVVSRDPLGIRRGDERRPGRVGIRGVVSILQRSGNRVPRPPEVVVVLVVPAVDRRVRPAQVLQREEPCAVCGVETGPCDELPGDFVPTRNRVSSATTW